MFGMKEDNKRKLFEALKDIELTSAEKQSLEWLTEWESSTVNNIISVIEKVREQGGE